MNRTVYKFFFACYLAILIYVVFFLPSRQEIVRYNLIPFKTIYWYLMRFELFKLHIPTDYGIEAQVYGNVLAFIPFGFMLPLIFDKMSKLSWVFLTAALASVCIELIQRFFRVGELDVDDVILNTCGGVGGFILFAVYNWVTHLRAAGSRNN